MPILTTVLVPTRIHRTRMVRLFIFINSTVKLLHVMLYKCAVGIIGVNIVDLSFFNFLKYLCKAQKAMFASFFELRCVLLSLFWLSSETVSVDTFTFTVLFVPTARNGWKIDLHVSACDS